MTHRPEGAAHDGARVVAVAGVPGGGQRAGSAGSSSAAGVATLPRWMVGAGENTWHNPISGGKHPKTACGKQLRTPVHGARGDLPFERGPAGFATAWGRALAEFDVCHVCARKLGVDPSGERRTLRDARLHQALSQAEYRPYEREL